MPEHLDAANVNLVTCGGQATVPVVAAISRVTDVFYAEIVASIASRSAGPGTRANIDEFTDATASALSTIGGAAAGKAIIVLNPAEPPMMMRNTVYCAISDDADHAELARVHGRDGRARRGLMCPDTGSGPHCSLTSLVLSGTGRARRCPA